MAVETISNQRIASPVTPAPGGVIPQMNPRGGTFLRYRVPGTVMGGQEIVRFPATGPQGQTIRFIRR